MLECWNVKPEDRPLFGNIVKTVGDYLMQAMGYLELTCNEESPCCGTVAEEMISTYSENPNNTEEEHFILQHSEENETNKEVSDWSQSVA